MLNNIVPAIALVFSVASPIGAAAWLWRAYHAFFVQFDAKVKSLQNDLLNAESRNDRLEKLLESADARFDRLEAEHKELRCEIDAIRAENARVVAENTLLFSENKALKAENTELKTKITVLTKRVSELEKRGGGTGAIVLPS